MPAPINFSLTSNALEVASHLQEFPAEARGAIASAFDKENLITVGTISQDRLTGTGPFPVSAHKLGVRSGRLRGSLRAAKAEISGDTIESSIGTNVLYARPHEFGFTGTVNVAEHTRRNFRYAGDGRRRYKTLDKSGHIVTNTRRGEVASTSTVRAHVMRMNMPARAPIQTGIRDRVGDYGAAVSAAIVAAWEGKS